jgi:GNAT superfamily N-acetyltransferase
MRANEFLKQYVAEGSNQSYIFYRGEPILSSDRLKQLQASIGKPYPILRKEGSPSHIGTYMLPDRENAEGYVKQALAGKGKGGTVTKIEVDVNSFKNGDGGVDQAVIITNIAGLVSKQDPDPKDPLRINDRKKSMVYYLGPGVKKYLNDPYLNDPELVKKWYDPEFAKRMWDIIKSGKQAVTKPGENQIQERMIKILGPLAEKIRRDPEVINYFLRHSSKDWVERNFRMNSDGSGTKVIDVQYFPPVTKEGVAEGTSNITYKQQKGKNKFSIEMSVDGRSAGIFQYDADTGRTLVELDPAFRGQGLGQRLILKGIYTAAMLGMNYVEDESRTQMFDRAMDSLADAGYIVQDEEYWYVTDSGKQFLKQRVAEGTLI